jgi:hypothetical protein
MLMHHMFTLESLLTTSLMCIIAFGAFTADLTGPAVELLLDILEKKELKDGNTMHSYHITPTYT